MKGSAPALMFVVVGLAAPGADASPPASWAPDDAGWALPLAEAQRELDRSDPPSATDGARRAATWLSMVPDRALTRRLRDALRLRVALSQRDSARIRSLVASQLKSCVPVEDAPWAHEAVADVVAAVSATLAWSMLADAPLVPETLPLWANAPPAVRQAAERRWLVDAPHHPTSLARAQELGVAGIAAVLPRLEDRIARAEALLEAHENDLARTEALAWLDASGPDPGQACLLAYVAGKAARKQRRYSEALRHLGAAQSRCLKADDQERVLQASLLQARVHRILQSPSAIRAAFDRARSLAPDHSFLDDFLFLEADAHDAAGRAARAAAVYEEQLSLHPRGDMAARAAWRRARALLDDDPAGAQVWLARILDTAPRGSRDHERAQYWHARLDEAIDRDRALDAYVQLFRRMGYYGLLAHQRLARLDPEAADRVQDELRSRVLGPDPDRSLTALTALSALIARLDPSSPASHAARAAATTRRLKGDAWARATLEERACDAEPKRRFELASVLVALDDHAAAQRVLRPAQEAWLGEAGEPSLQDWRTAYSRPHWDAIESAAQAEGIDPLLLVALAREESTFDPEIVSWAGAIGLTQLMPPTAYGAHAAVFRRPLADLDALRDPRLNARLGAHVLAEGFARWGTAPLAISAYNAGSGLTARFQAVGPLPFDQFVERISVRQTRGYVMRVLESWARYRLLYGTTDRFVRLPARIP